jgi:hypothetical protein
MEVNKMDLRIDAIAKKFTEFGFKNDTSNSWMLARELEHVLSKIQEIKFPAMKGRLIVPLSFEAPSYVETISDRTEEEYGDAKVGVANSANDIPMVGISGRLESRNVVNITSAYGYNVDELEASRALGKPLSQRLARVCKSIIMRQENNLILTGNTAFSVNGFLNNPNIPETTIPATGTGSVKTWTDANGAATKTPDQIITDIALLITAIDNESGGIIQDGLTLLLPNSLYSYLSLTRLDALGSTTILDFIMNKIPQLREVERLKELETIGAGSTRRMIIYERNEDTLRCDIPLNFKQLPTQTDGLSFKTICRLKNAGVKIYQPFATRYGDGI